jgi:hypothetical protein
MWRKKTERSLPVQVEFDLGEIIYFRLAQFACYQDIRISREPTTRSHQDSRPQLPVYPGKFSFAGVTLK